MARHLEIDKARIGALATISAALVALGGVLGSTASTLYVVNHRDNQVAQERRIWLEAEIQNRMTLSKAVIQSMGIHEDLGNTDEAKREGRIAAEALCYGSLGSDFLNLTKPASASKQQFDDNVIHLLQELAANKTATNSVRIRCRNTLKYIGPLLAYATGSQVVDIRVLGCKDNARFESDMLAKGKGPLGRSQLWFLWKEGLARQWDDGINLSKSTMYDGSVDKDGKPVVGFIEQYGMRLPEIEK